MKTSKYFILQLILTGTLQTHAAFFESDKFGPIPPAGGPTSLRDPEAPWNAQNVMYEKFVPNLLNPKDTVKPSDTVRFKIIGDTAYIEGEINAHVNDIIKFYHYDTQPITTVVLNSFGGHAEAGNELAQWIREQSITTIVPANGTCASACTMVFMGGVVRKAARYSVFLFHGVRAGPTSMQTLYKDKLERDGQAGADLLWKEWLDRVQVGTKKMFDLYEALGATQELRRYYFSLPEDPDYFNQGNPMKIMDWRLNATEASHYNVVTELF